MSERKYRQRGYQDEPRERTESRPQQKKEYAPRGQPPVSPKTFDMPGFREVVRCARCGHQLTVASAWSPGLAEGRPERLRVLRTAHDGRTRNRVLVQRTDERATGVR
jgi:hypothetical protein